MHPFFQSITQKILLRTHILGSNYAHEFTHYNVYFGKESSVLLKPISNDQCRQSSHNFGMVIQFIITTIQTCIDYDLT